MLVGSWLVSGSTVDPNSAIEGRPEDSTELTDAWIGGASWQWSASFQFIPKDLGDLPVTSCIEMDVVDV